MNKKITLIIFLSIVSLSSKADIEKEYKPVHKQKQQKLFATLDYCSNIAAQDIFSIGSKDLSKIKEQLDIIKTSFSTFKKEKENCFDQAKYILDDIIADNFVCQQQENSTYLEIQNKVDMNFADTISLRKKINSQLLDSILKDIEKSIKDNDELLKKETLQNNKQLKSFFVKESNETKTLIKQELNIIYDSMQTQLKLDEDFLNYSKKPTIPEVAEITIRSAFISVNRAMQLFENLETSSKAYNLAKVRTHIQNAHNKLLELKSFSNTLEGLDSKKDINKVIDKLSIITVDLDVTIKDLVEESFSENFLAWAAQIYQQCSNSATQLQKILDTVYLINITQEPAKQEISKPLNQSLDQQAPLEQPSDHKTPKLLKDKEQEQISKT